MKNEKWTNIMLYHTKLNNLYSKHLWIIQTETSFLKWSREQKNSRFCDSFMLVFRNWYRSGKTCRHLRTRCISLHRKVPRFLFARPKASKYGESVVWVVLLCSVKFVIVFSAVFWRKILAKVRHTSTSQWKDFIKTLAPHRPYLYSNIMIIATKSRQRTLVSSIKVFQ